MSGDRAVQWVIGPVLLVEQEWPLRSLLKAQLEEEGLWVVAVPTVRDALAFLRRWQVRPALVLLDLARQPSEEIAQLQVLLDTLPGVPTVLLRSPLVAARPDIERQVARVLTRPLSIGEVVRAVLDVLAAA